MQILILLLDIVDVGECVGENLGFLQGTSPGSRSLLVHSSGGDGFLQRKELGIHVCAITLLDDIVSGALGSVACLGILTGGGVIGVMGETSSLPTAGGCGC